jgi:ribosomal protein L11 methyltransferase
LALGIDIDLPSVQAATENATLNGFGGVCQFSAAQLSELDRNFDVLVANIDARTLAALAPELCARVSPGAPIALTGVLLEQAPAVQRAFEAQGCRLEQATSEDDWCLLSLAR